MNKPCLLPPILDIPNISRSSPVVPDCVVELGASVDPVVETVAPLDAEVDADADVEHKAMALNLPGNSARTGTRTGIE